MSRSIQATVGVLILSFAAPGRATTTQPSTPAEAAKEVDRREMIEGLLDQGDQGDIMGRILKRMRDSYELLAQKYDPGLITQEIQRRIVADLAKAMQAARRGRSRSGSPQSQPSQDKPQKKSPRRQNDKAQAKAQQKKAARADPRKRTRPAVQAGRGRPQKTLRAGSIDETRRTWGNIPPKDRDEVVQGYSEEVISKYRRQVTRYYEALSTGD